VSRGPAPSVDARGLRCPLPVIELSRAAAGRAPGTELELLATDPATRHDVPAWCRMRGAELLTVEEGEDGAWRFVVRLGG
jgi:tRNA 2-thiouridine synthesizing protein A